MLKEQEIEFEYREYVREPLSESELAELFTQLDLSPREVLRPRDRAAKALSGGETDEDLLRLMAQHPTLLQRPIAVHGDRAVVGRPPTRILELLG